MKRFLAGLLLAAMACASVQAQTLQNPHYIAYPAGASTRLDDAVAAVVTADAGKQPLDGDLTSLAAAASTGALYYRSASSTWSPVTIGSGVGFTAGTLSATGTGGSVTSVGLTSTDFTVSGSPVTGSGSITANLATAQPSAHTWAAAQTFTLAPVFTNQSGSRTALGLATVASSGSASDLGAGTLLAARMPALTGDVTSAAGSVALTLATAQPAVHTWALAQTFTVAPVFTDQSGSRSALGLGTLATQSGTFSGTSSGTNTGDETTGTIQTKLSASSVTANQVYAGPTTGVAAAAGFRALVAADIPALTGDVTKASGSAATVLATAQPAVHTWALAQTFTVAPVFTDTSGSRTALGVAIGTNVEAWDADLDCYAGLTATGFLKHTGAGTCTSALLVAGDIPDISATYLTAATAATTYQPTDADLTSIAGNATGGFLTRTAANTYTPRTITGSTNVSVSNGDGVSGAPTISLTGVELTANKGAASGYAGLDGSSLLATSTIPALTGDVTKPAGSGVTTLASVITAGGPTGSTSVVPVITYDAKGRLTAVTTATITPAAIAAQATSAKDVSGGYAGLVSGTWTPTVTFSTPGTFSATYTTQTGSYTQVADQVTLWFRIVFTPTLGTASGTFRIAGVPVTVSDTTTPTGAVRGLGATFTWPTGCTNVVANVQSASTLGIGCTGSGVAAADFGPANLTTGSAHTIVGSITYKH